MKKRTLFDLQQMKKRGDKAVWITAYDAVIASYAEAAELDMLLVGDSLGMCVCGYQSTVPVTMEDCIHHAKAVRTGAPNTFLIGDMPFGSYQASVEDAVGNAVRFLKEAGMDAIKLEGGRRVTRQIRAIVDSGMVMMAHIGLTPQSSGQLGGHKAQGRTIETARAVIEDALAVEEAGAHMLLVEAVSPEVTTIIAERLKIPVYSIGAGVHCDGQILIVSDLLGMFEAFTPKFVKRYANLGDEIRKAFVAYRDEVRSGAFPGPEHVYPMVAGEVERIGELRKEYLGK